MTGNQSTHTNREIAPLSKVFRLLCYEICGEFRF